MIRLCDILLSGAALALLLPLFVPIIIILRLTGEGEIFFLQDRVGKGGRVFKLYKFATMLKDSPNIGSGTVTMKGDSRVLPVGRVLRKTKVNELPQLINIFLGHMSLVGPRPLTNQTFAAYPEAIQLVIQEVKPGLSGIGSIIFRAEEEIMQGNSATLEFYEETIAPYKGTLEKWFVENKSIYLYFLAIIVTVWVVFIPRSQVAWKVFKGLPAPPHTLRHALNFSGQNS